MYYISGPRLNIVADVFFVMSSMIGRVKADLPPVVRDPPSLVQGTRSDLRAKCKEQDYNLIRHRIDKVAHEYAKSYQSFNYRGSFMTDDIPGGGQTVNPMIRRVACLWTWQFAVEIFAALQYMQLEMGLDGKVTLMSDDKNLTL